MNAAVSAAEKAALLQHYKTTVSAFEDAAKQAILSPMGQCPNGPGCRHPACRIDGCKSAILSHYSAQAALASDACLYGPALCHPMDPRTPDDDSLTPEEALEAATDEAVRTPYSVAWWLDQTVGRDTSAMPACTESIWQITHMTSVPRLLTLVMDGNNAQIINAAKRLRELYVSAQSVEIAERAAELLKGQA